MKNSTHYVVEPNSGVKNEEHVAREERDREKWPGIFFPEGSIIEEIGINVSLEPVSLFLKSGCVDAWPPAHRAYASERYWGST